MRFIDFFSGIGGMRLGLEQAGHKAVGFCEIDKWAQKSYCAMYDPESKGEWKGNDIRTVDASVLPRADIWCFGFPCQDVSVCGARRGFVNENGEFTRSGLFFEIIRLLAESTEENKPKWLLAENVRGLFTIDNGFGFLRLLVEMGKVGYDFEWQLLNSKNFGVPQNRERVFLVGSLRGRCTGKVFPLSSATIENTLTVKQIGQTAYSENSIKNNSAAGREPLIVEQKLISIEKNVGKIVDVANTIDANYYKGIGDCQARTGVIRIPLTMKREYVDGKRIQVARENTTYIANCLTCKCGLNDANADGVNALLEDVSIRRLTPKECWRLQAFPDEYFDKAQKAGVSDTQLYKQAGNAITVSVSRAIGMRLKELEDKNGNSVS